MFKIGLMSVQCQHAAVIGWQLVQVDALSAKPSSCPACGQTLQRYSVTWVGPTESSPQAVEPSSGETAGEREAADRHLTQSKANIFPVILINVVDLL